MQCIQSIRDLLKCKIFLKICNAYNRLEFYSMQNILLFLSNTIVNDININFTEYRKMQIRFNNSYLKRENNGSIILKCCNVWKSYQNNKVKNAGDSSEHSFLRLIVPHPF